MQRSRSSPEFEVNNAVVSAEHEEKEQKEAERERIFLNERLALSTRRIEMLENNLDITCQKLRESIKRSDQNRTKLLELSVSRDYNTTRTLLVSTITLCVVLLSILAFYSIRGFPVREIERKQISNADRTLQALETPVTIETILPTPPSQQHIPEEPKLCRNESPKLFHVRYMDSIDDTLVKTFIFHILTHSYYA